MLLEDNTEEIENIPSAQNEKDDIFAQKNVQELRAHTLNNDLLERKVRIKERQLTLMRKMQLMRQSYAKKSLCLVWVWTIFVIILTGLQFCKPYNMQLHKAEFIAIVATALASFIGLYLQVGKGIFPKDL